VELGRKITADYVAQGRIGRFGGDLTIKVELYHSMSGSLVASFTGNSKEVHGLLSILDAKAPEMFKKMLPVSSDSRGVPSVEGGIGDLEKAIDYELEEQPQEVAAVAAESSERKECVDKLISGIKDEIPSKLQDCPIELGKNKAKAALPFSKVPPEDIDPKKFMPKCVVSGIKKKFPVADKFAGNIESFVQKAMNAALSASGDIDVPKLLNAAKDVDGLLRDIEKSLEGASEEELCEEPEAPVEYAASEAAGGKEEKSMFSLGFRVGFNFSHVYEAYERSGVRNSGFLDDIAGFQAGLAFDFALSGWFHLQPSVMYIRKGAKYKDYEMTENYLEIPLLVSLKFSVLRVNAGPYFSVGSFDYGLSLGGGFDVGSFYLGMFYDYGLADVSKKDYFTSYNYTLGFGLGYNL
jgi:hypothetical protein